MASKASFRLSILGALLTVALASGVVGLWPDPRPGYGYGYKKCGRACEVRKCRGTCNKARRTCAYCAKQDKKALLASCTAGKGPCRAQAKQRLRELVGTCRSATGSCGGCCKSGAGEDCPSSFSGTRGFGSYFRTVRHYGKVRRYKPNCDLGDCAAVCEASRQRALAACAQGGCSAEQTAGIERQYSVCQQACAGSTTTTTTTLPGGSPSGAYLASD